MLPSFRFLAILRKYQYKVCSFIKDNEKLLSLFLNFNETQQSENEFLGDIS